MILKVIIWFLLIAILIFAGFIIYITITDYKPDKVEIIVDNDVASIGKLQKDTFSLMNWNIGYAGLGADMDFFYDGGTRTRTSKEVSKKHLDDILAFIESSDTVDFWLIQEVDVEAKRSYYVNQVKKIIDLKKNSHGVFARNYMCKHVPIPVSSPLGYVEAGLMTFSEFPPLNATRFAYPLIASWPNKLFLLDRCFLLNRYPLDNGKDLIVINTHNSAYVLDSLKRIEELQIIKKIMLEEFNKGNYVIAGGDWNQNPPGYSPVDNYGGHKFKASVVKMNNDFMPSDWQWAFDAKIPTNRSNYQPYVIGENTTTCLDYYLVSPNIEILDVKVIDQIFEHSDHQPVYLKASLKE